MGVTGHYLFKQYTFVSYLTSKGRVRITRGLGGSHPPKEGFTPPDGRQN